MAKTLEKRLGELVNDFASSLSRRIERNAYSDLNRLVHSEFNSLLETHSVRTCELPQDCMIALGNVRGAAMELAPSLANAYRSSPESGFRRFAGNPVNRIMVSSAAAIAASFTAGYFLPLGWEVAAAAGIFLITNEAPGYFASRLPKNAAMQREYFIREVVSAFTDAFQDYN